MDEFYEAKNPYLAIFDLNTGKIVSRFGNLDIPQKLSRTGYYYVNAVVDVEKEKIVYGNGYMGKLYLANYNTPDKIEKEITVFNIETEKFPPFNPNLFYSLEYAKTYDPFFKDCIEKVVLSGGNIHCLIRTGNPHKKDIKSDIYKYVCIDAATGQIKNEYPIVSEFEQDRIFSYGLAQMGKEISPYCFFSCKNQYLINFIKTVAD